MQSSEVILANTLYLWRYGGDINCFAEMVTPAKPFRAPSEHDAHQQINHERRDNRHASSD
jgi:hypothetical protein